MSNTLLSGAEANELYEMLSPQLREKLATFGRSWSAPGGTHLFQHAAVPEHLIVLHAGKVEIILYSAGKSVSCDFCEAGKVFGMRAVVTGEPQELDVLCIEPCSVTSFPRDMFLALLKANPEMYSAVVRVLGSDLQIANGILRNTVHRRSRSKGSESTRICVM